MSAVAILHFTPSPKIINNLTLTQLFLSLCFYVCLTAAADLFVFFHQHPLQTSPEQRRHTNCLLSSGAVDDDGVQASKTIAFQQGY